MFPDQRTDHPPACQAQAGQGSLATQAAIQTFCDRVEGAWWERIGLDDGNAISFFHIEPDPLFNSVRLDGKSFDREGNQAANWWSVLGRADPDENRIRYHWMGWHIRPDLANIPFHGFGEMDFDKPGDPFGTISRGEGKFWNIDEAHPERTIVKPVQLRRVVAKDAVETMMAGTEKEVRTLVKKTLRQW